MIKQLIKNIFDSQRKHFSKNGKLEKFHAFFEATETVFFIPANVTETGPHVRDSLDVKRFMIIVLVALIPPFLFGIYNAGYQSNLASGLSIGFFPVALKGLGIVMPLVILSYMVGFAWELLFAVKRKHKISEGFFVTALLFPLTLPPTIPLWQAAVGISFGVVIGKEIFGGTGRNFLNPALVGRAFIFFAYPGKMSGDVWVAVSNLKDKAVDAVAGATPLSLTGLLENYEKAESVLAKAGYTFSKLLMGLYPGSIGGTSALMSAIGAFILVLVGIASYRIVIGGVLGVLITGFFLNLVASDSSMAWLSLNPFYHLVMGGFAFGMAYMATEPVTGPDMDFAKWIYGFAIGVLTVLIRVFNPAYPEGVMLAILFMNVFAPLLDHFEVKAKLKKRIPNV
ncbi:MAG: NADH:ubiquinone reductase (Na(+)-transporting) subunit B [Desulfobacteraceae bacterium]|nr:NADH:ubiquinone reductase (Na(+)-transporting) subunit B [Desulfobacteraceae bacterium]